MKYGPLHGRTYSLKDFNLIWGGNEEGKTLMIDALLRMIFGKKEEKKFKGIDRVTEDPIGKILFTDGNDDYDPLKYKDFLKKINITSDEFRNIFIIRNSDLSIESGYYSNFTERLTGERIKEIEDIIKKLREIGRLTDTLSDISDEQKFGKLRTKLTTSDSLRKKIKSLKDRFENEKINEVHRECFELEERINENKEKIERLENARKREKYEKGSSILNEINNLISQINELSSFNEKERENWTTCEEGIKRLKEEKERLESEINRKKEELEGIKKDLYSREERKRVEKIINGEVEGYEEKRGKLKSHLLVFFIFLFIGSLIGIILKPSLIFYILIPTLLIFLVVAGMYFYKIKRAEKSLYELVAKEIGIQVQSVDKIRFQFQLMEREYEETKKKLEEKENELRLRNEEIKNLENKINSLIEEIEKIKDRAKVSSIEEFTQHLEKKRRLTELIKEKEGILSGLFGKKYNTLKENLSFWGKEIKELEVYKDKATDISGDEKEEEELRKKIDEDRNKLDEKKKKLDDFQNDIKKLGRKQRKL